MPEQLPSQYARGGS